MMSVKTKYAIAVIMKMANDTTELFSIKQLSESCRVPKKYLEQILNALRKSGIVKSLRGIQGGYQINKDLADITVYDIAHCLENSLLFSAGYSGTKTLKSFWLTMDDKVKDVLSITIEDLVQDQLKQERCLSYTI